MTFTTVPSFLIAFMAGLLAMQALEVYAVNAWNVGTLKVEPWRSRVSGFCRSARSMVTAILNFMLGRGTRPSRAWIPLALTAALLCAAYVHAATPTSVHGLHVLAAAITLGTPAEMRDRREKLIREAGDLMGANNSFETPDKRTKFDAIMVDVEGYRVAIEDTARAEQFSALSRSTLPESQRQEERHQRPEAVLYDRAVELYLRGVPMSEMAKEERSALQSGYRSFSSDQRQMVSQAMGEQRDMATFSAPGGGFLVLPDTRFYGVILQAKKFFGGMEAAGAEVINTDTAGDLPIPMGDDTGNVGTIIPEAKASGHAGGTSPTLTELVLHGYLYSSKVVKVSWQMMRDPAIQVDQYVGGLLGQRLARAQNTHFTSSGTGSGQPYALTKAVTVGKQSAVGNTTSVPFDDIYRVLHSVDVAYRTPLARWMMHDTSALVLRLAKDGVGRYLWPELSNVQAGQPSMLAGYGVTINNDMPAMAASAVWGTFGEHQYYKIRRVRGITIVRINELYVESGQVGFLAFETADGGYANPGQNPIKGIQNSAT